MINYNSNVELINYSKIEDSLLLKVAKEFFEFPDLLHDFKVHTTSEEHFISIEFYNYGKTHCSVLYHYKTNELRFKKGIGGINFDYLRLVNVLISLNIWIKS